MLKIAMANTGDADRSVYHAVDTEVSHIDVSEQCPVGHGRVTCFSVYCGPDVDWEPRGKRLEELEERIDGARGREAQDAAVGGHLLLGDEGWKIFKPYFESPDEEGVAQLRIRQARHREPGVKLAGFAADTMHKRGCGTATASSRAHCSRRCRPIPR